MVNTWFSEKLGEGARRGRHLLVKTWLSKEVMEEAGWVGGGIGCD